MRDVVATVVPADCRVCAAPLERAGLVPVCDACVGQVDCDRTVGSAPVGCWRCGDLMDAAGNLEVLDMEDRRFAQGLGSGLLCRACRMVPPAFERAVSYGTYTDELRELIGLLKFDRVRAVAALLGPRLAEAMLELERDLGQSPDAEVLVVAVPLFARRERERRFNQSVLLAEQALRTLQQLRPGWRLVAQHDALERRRSTEESFTLSRRARRRNMRGAFRVRGKVSGRDVMLIDDIFTSGATARECARVLRAAGAARVWVATVARSRTELQKRQMAGNDEVAVWDMAAGPATGTATAGAQGNQHGRAE